MSGLPVAEFWYAIEPAGAGVLHLREAWIDPYLAGDMWLLRGRERDLLVDTGTGMVSPRLGLDAIVERPLLAVALNAFYDHAGGLHAFAERGCHHLAAPSMAAPTPESSLTATYVGDGMLLALPRPGYRTADYAMRGAAPTVTFRDGDRIDLGGRRLEVLHVPGMSADSMALWDAAEGALFAGDTLFADPEPARVLNPDDHRAFDASLDRLLTLPVRTVYGGHFGAFPGSRMPAIVADYRKRRVL